MEPLVEDNPSRPIPRHSSVSQHERQQHRTHHGIPIPCTTTRKNNDRGLPILHTGDQDRTHTILNKPQTSPRRLLHPRPPEEGHLNADHQFRNLSGGSNNVCAAGDTHKPYQGHSTHQYHHQRSNQTPNRIPEPHSTHSERTRPYVCQSSSGPRHHPAQQKPYTLAI